jgi:hypothetical protein
MNARSPYFFDQFAERSYQSTIALAGNAAERAHRFLRTEMVEALMQDPTRIVQTPGFNMPAMSAANVVADNFSGSRGEASLLELLRIVAACAASTSNPELRIRAQAWISGAAKEHADFHRDDLANDLGA